jgi:hypothetical protein
MSASWSGIRRVLGGVVMAVAAMAAHAAPPVEGVTFEDAVTIAGQKLALNGIGVGQQLIEKVHVSALYLNARKSDTAGVLAADGAKRLETVFVRKVSARALSRFFVNGLRKSAESRALMQHITDVARFGELFDKSGERAAGDRVTMDWVPGSGIEVRINGKLLTPIINNEPIYRLLLDMYVGPDANKRLREGLLQPPAAAAKT